MNKKITTIVVGTLTIIAILALFWAFSLKGKLDDIIVNKHPLIDPARNLISQDNFLTTIEPIRKAINAYVTKEKMQTSIYVEFLNTGANININQNSRYWPASLAKLPIAMATMYAIEKGDWSFDQKFTIEDDDRYEISSDIYNSPAGTTFTVRDLLEKTLVSSDNTAYRILLRNIPQSKIDAMILASGLDQLFDNDGRINAKEYSRFFRILYTSSFLTREHSEYILKLLDKSTFTHFLREGVPETIVFPHKFGDNPEAHAFNDSGIVYLPNRPYLITVIIQGDGKDGEEEKAKEEMNYISKISYEYFSQAK